MSEIRANTISDAAGTGPIDLYKQSAAKVWVNYNTITTTSINGSFNVSSLTDSGGGVTDVNFSNAFLNTTYASVGTSNNFHVAIGNTTSSTARSTGFYVSGTGGQRALYDMSAVGNAYYGDLA